MAVSTRPAPRSQPALPRRGSPRSRLQLVDAQPRQTPERLANETAQGSSPTREPESVLVAGSDAQARGRMLVELRSLLPPGTRFVEASETWELIALTPDSRMVVLTGALGETSAGSALRLLARRDPTLPVLVVGQAGADRRHRAIDTAGI